MNTRKIRVAIFATIFKRDIELNRMLRDEKMFLKEMEDKMVKIFDNCHKLTDFEITINWLNDVLETRMKNYRTRSTTNQSEEIIRRLENMSSVVNFYHKIKLRQFVENGGVKVKKIKKKTYKIK